MLCNLQSSNITEASPSDCLVSYPENLLESYPFSKMQSVYSAAQANWATFEYRRAAFIIIVLSFTGFRYHTITGVCITALLPTKPSSDDDSGFRHGFGAEASLSRAQSAQQYLMTPLDLVTL